jgi:hypothetical protein
MRGWLEETPRLAAAHAHRDRLELRLALGRQAPPAEAALVDEDELRAVLQVLPDLKSAACADAHIALLQNLVGFSERYQDLAPLSEPAW